MSSSAQMTSMYDKVLPSLSVSIGSNSETSPDKRFVLRKYIRTSFSMHLAAYVAKRAPFSALNEDMALISPMVPIEIKSSCSAVCV
jgi:hypothetical protein